MGELDCFDRLERMGVLGLTKEAIHLVLQNFRLFFTFVTSFTIPSSIFTIMLVSAIDIHHRYVIDDFISPGELVIFGWKFKTLISPLGLNLGFIILNLLPMAWLNTVVCTQGVVCIYRKEDLTMSIKNSFLNLHWAVLRLIATQILFYSFLVIILGFALIVAGSSSDTHIVSLMCWVLTGIIFILIYHLPVPQVAVLERGNYGFRGIYRAMEMAYSKLWTSSRLALFSVSYFCLLKLLVDILHWNSYPFWTKFLVYLPLVIYVTAMSIFWQVVYTIFSLSTIQVDLDKVYSIPSDLESTCQAADINQPLLADEVERNEGISSTQHRTM